MKQKLTLKFVNRGKPFEVPDWTVEKHEKAIALAVEYTKNNKDLSEVRKENELKYAIIYETLLEIDKTVKIESVREFFTHPENLVDAFNLIYYAGKKDIHFHGGEKRPRKKSSI